MPWRSAPTPLACSIRTRESRAACSCCAMQSSRSRRRSRAGRSGASGQLSRRWRSAPAVRYTSRHGPSRYGREHISIRWVSTSEPATARSRSFFVGEQHPGGGDVEQLDCGGSADEGTRRGRGRPRESQRSCRSRVGRRSFRYSVNMRSFGFHALVVRLAGRRSLLGLSGGRDSSRRVVRASRSGLASAGGVSPAGVAPAMPREAAREP